MESKTAAKQRRMLPIVVAAAGRGTIRRLWSSCVCLRRRLGFSSSKKSAESSGAGGLSPSSLVSSSPTAKAPHTRPSTTEVFSLVDIVVTVVGFVAVLIIILSFTTDVFGQDPTILTRFNYGDGLFSSFSSSSSSQREQQHNRVVVREVLHGLLDGRVGKGGLATALSSRREERRRAIRRSSQMAVEAAVRRGVVLPSDLQAVEDRVFKDALTSSGLRKRGSLSASNENDGGDNHDNGGDGGDSDGDVLFAQRPLALFRRHLSGKLRPADKEQFLQQQQQQAGGVGEENGLSQLSSSFSLSPIAGEETYFGPSTTERQVFEEEASFFVSIAQFRDIFCPNTIAEIYANARNPRRVFCGISDQRYNSTLFSDSNSIETVGAVVWDTEKLQKNVDGTCVPWYVMKQCRTDEFCITDNIRARKLWPHDAKGPTLGRYFTMLLYQGESYYMMIDSHSRFVKHWDMQIVLNLMLVPKETYAKRRGILSHYPAGFEKFSQLRSHRIDSGRMVMCSAHYTDAGIIRMRGDTILNSGFPEIQPFSAGGFVVGDAAFVHEVPFDPYLYYVFDGEEVLYSMRMWTHGWDMFTPKNNILFHHYARHHAPRFWGERSNGAIERRQALSDKGRQRVHYFMQNQIFDKNGAIGSDDVLHVSAKKANAARVDIEEDVYGMGKARSLTEYRLFAQYDPKEWFVNVTFCELHRFHNDSSGKGFSRVKYHPVDRQLNDFYNGKADRPKAVPHVPEFPKRPKVLVDKLRRIKASQDAANGIASGPKERPHVEKKKGSAPKDGG